MAHINLFQGGQGRAISSDCGCGPFPTEYPSPNRVAVHYKAQRFTLSDMLNPGTNTNKRCVLCAAAPDAAAQAANLIDKKIGLLRIPPRHLFTALRVVAAAGTNGAGLGFEVYADAVNPHTGAAIGSHTFGAGVTGTLTLAANGDTLDTFDPIDVPTGGWYSSADAIEVGVIIKVAPTPSASLATMCQWDGHIDLIAKVDGFDYGNE